MEDSVKQAEPAQEVVVENHGVVTFATKDDSVVLGVDVNRNGTDSVKLRVGLNEVVDEVFGRQANQTDNTKVEYDIKDGNLVVRLVHNPGTDDAKELASVTVNILELLSEGRGLLAKKETANG